MSEVTAQLGTLLFGTPNPEGYEFTIDNDLEGWADGPGVRGEAVPRMWEHGEFSERGYREARLITIAGTMFGGNEVTATAAQRHFTSVLADGKLGTLTVNDPAAGVLTATVKLAAAPRFRWVTNATATYMIQVKAPNPRKYAALVQATTTVAGPAGGLALDLFTQNTLGVLDFGAAGNTGTVTVYNEGTAETSVLFTLTGPTVASTTITETGTQSRLVFADVIPVGSFVELNGADGSVTLNGYADRSTSLTRRDWTTVPPGGSRTYLFESPGATTATMQVGVSSAWW